MGALVAQPISRLNGRRALIALAVLVALAGSAGALLALASRSVTPHRASAAVFPPPTPSFPAAHPRVVVALPPGQAPAQPASVAPENEPLPADRGATNAQIKKWLSEAQAFQQDVAGVPTVHGAPGTILSGGLAVVPLGVPPVVAAIIKAGNEIATKPYLWGGGHGSWIANGYDCSGSVSFALAGAGLLSSPLTSGEFESWGDPGPGKYVTIYANAGHVWMYVAGLRFDTAGESAGTRWQHGADPGTGFVVRHPPGL